MAKGNAIAAAVLAAAGNPGTASSPGGQGGLSPLIASYSQQYSVNRPYSPLPRPAPVFLEGAFGPGAPTTAMPIDPPREDTQRPDLRRFQYEVNYNLPAGTPGSEGYKLAPFATLRALADSYSLARTCVDKRKSEIIGLEWDIVPTDEAEHALMGDDKARGDWDERRAKVIEFFKHPDSDRAKYPTFQAWLSGLLEDRFVCDAVAVHLVPPRRKGAGLFGSDIASLDLIDGTTIRPMLNTLGATPRPPAVGYQAYEWGVPRVDLMSVINGDDLDNLDEPVADFRADQLIYMRESPRGFTPYGLSCIEKALLPISIGLARQQYRNLYYQDGSIPGMFVTPGPDISTPQQIRQLQDALNAMANDIGAKHRIIVLPPGSTANPQKPVPLADQTDEWIAAEVTMPFGLTPMDVGITPRVSAVQSPGESRELSHINSDKGSQHRIEPVCADLKSVIFDYVIQDLFKQKDMEWSWGLKDRGKNREQIIAQGVQRVQIGAETIDEFRIELGEQPYGLPETSTPLAYTASGPVPLAAIASEQAPAQAGVPGQPGAPQPGQAAGNTPPQVQDDDLTTPMHEAHADLPDTPDGSGSPAPGKDKKDGQEARKAELEILARYLRKGRDPAAFRPDCLPQQAIDAAARALPLGTGQAVKAARDAAAAKDRQDRRDKRLEAAAAAVAARLGRLVRGHKAGDLSLAHLVDGAVAVMADGYRQAMHAGTADAAADYDDTPPLARDDIASGAADAAEEQRGYLTGLLQDIISGLSAAAIGSRLGQYAATLWRAYNGSYGNTVMTAHPDYKIIWELGDNRDHCRACVARDGKEFTIHTLPGWPGDGGFGDTTGALGQQNICAGGANCHCSVRFVQGGQTLATGTNTQLPGATSYYQDQLAAITGARQQAADARDQFLGTIPAGPAIRAATRDELRRQVAGLVNQSIAESGGYPGVSVEPQDIPADIIAAMLPPGMEGAAGLTVPRLDLAGAVARMFAAKGSLAKLDMTRDGFTAILAKAIAGTVAAMSGPPADPEKVYRQLARNYRPEGISWVLHTSWTGPVNVPLDLVHDGSEDTWAASEPGANAEHVKRFQARIENGGEDVSPVVMVQVPGHAKLRVVDGHHRYLAYREADRPARAYVGAVADDSPGAPWAKTHLYQIHSGGDPLNKTGGEDPTRVCFLLMRAPNGNGKWRYLLQKRDDGTWGLPGGKSHAGELPWDAAVREAGEELGDLPSVRPAAVWTRTEDEHVVWTYLVDLPALFTPSVDGETSNETAGWGWFKRKDVEDLNLHPAMRDTWEQLDFAKPELGGDTPGTVKAASGYSLNRRSGMISLDLPAGLIDPVPGGVDDHHITIAYLGPDVDDTAWAEACRRAAAAAAALPGPLDGVISGLGTFEPSGSSDGKVVAWAGVTLPGAEQLRAALADLSASEHKNWQPHVTLAYLAQDDPAPDPVPATPVTFTRLSVHRGNDIAGFTLGGSDQPGEPHQDDRSACPCGVPVAYDVANGWQHADGSVSHDDGESVSDKMRNGDRDR